MKIDQSIELFGIIFLIKQEYVKAFEELIINCILYLFTLLPFEREDSFSIFMKYEI